MRSNLYVVHGGSTVAPQAALTTSTGLAETATGLGTAAIETVATAGVLARQARMKGYEGDACGECGNFTLVRNGTCLKCETCGGTTGCS